VEIMDPDGTVLRVARGDCAPLGDSHGMILAALQDASTSREVTRTLGGARVQGTAGAAGASGTMEVFLHELQPAAENPLPQADQPALCALAFVEALSAVPPAWVDAALGSLRDDTEGEPHARVPPATLVVGETRTPMALGETVTAPATEGSPALRVQLRANPWRLASLSGLQVHVPAGAFARVSGGSSNQAELRVVQGALELQLRVARAPSSHWAGSEQRLASAARHGTPSAPIALLGAERLGVLLPGEHGHERLYAFDHAGRMLEVSVAYAPDTDEAAVDALLASVVDSVTLSPQ
jgi:hypothetical protein